MNKKLRESLRALPPEWQAKAQGIKTQEELNEFLSENDIELPEDTLENVSGGCEVKQLYEKGHVFPGECPECGSDLVYQDNRNGREGYLTRAYCKKTGKMYYFINSESHFGRYWRPYSG